MISFNKSKSEILISPDAAEVQIITSFPEPVMIVFPTSTPIEITSFLLPDVILFVPAIRGV